MHVHLPCPPLILPHPGGGLARSRDHRMRCVSQRCRLDSVYWRISVLRFASRSRKKCRTRASTRRFLRSSLCRYNQSILQPAWRVTLLWMLPLGHDKTYGRRSWADVHEIWYKSRGVPRERVPDRVRATNQSRVSPIDFLQDLDQQASFPRWKGPPSVRRRGGRTSRLIDSY